MPQRVIAILGCTAAGKSALALALAERLGGEIVSIDSMAIYRGMDIGTAKPTPQQRARVPHHLIDVLDPWQGFDAAQFVARADAAVEQIHARGRPAIAVGGTLMYFKFFYEGLFAGPSADPQIRAEIRARAAREGVEVVHAELAAVDPQAAARIHRNDLRRIERALEVYRLTGLPISALQQQWDRRRLRRPEWQWRLVGLRRGREDCNRRINERVRAMVAAGLVQEARRLWSDPRGLSPQARQALGYAELFAHFEGRATLEDAVEQIKVHTRRLARHQRTWLKRFEGVRWIDVSEAGPEWSEVVRRAVELAAEERGTANDECRTRNGPAAAG